MAEIKTLNPSLEQENNQKESPIQKVIGWFFSLDKFSKIAIIILLIFLVVTPVIVTQRLLIEQKAATGAVSVYFTRHGSATPLTDLTFVPGETIEVDIYLDPKTSTVNGFDILTSLSSSSLTLGSSGVVESSASAALFNVPIFNDWQTTAWRYSKVSTNIEAPSFSGPQLLATVSLQAQTTGIGQLAFNPETQFTSPEVLDALLFDSQTLSFSVVNPTPTPTNTPVPTNTPTPVPPTSTPTNTPTPIPPTPTPTSTPVPSNTPTPTEIPTPTATIVPPTSTPISTNTPTPVVPTPTDVPTATPAAPTDTPFPTSTPVPIFVKEDINRDGCISILDFNIWLTTFKTQTLTPGTFPDVNTDGKINILDYNYWFLAMKTPGPDIIICK